MAATVVRVASVIRATATPACRYSVLASHPALGRPWPGGGDPHAAHAGGLDGWRSTTCPTAAATCAVWRGCHPSSHHQLQRDVVMPCARRHSPLHAANITVRVTSSVFYILCGDEASSDLSLPPLIMATPPPLHLRSPPDHRRTVVHIYIVELSRGPAAADYSF